MSQTNRLRSITPVTLWGIGSRLQKKRILACQEGSILVGIIMTMVVMATLGAGMIYFTTTSTFQELFANNHARAYYAAESGGRYVSTLIRQSLATGNPSLDSLKNDFTGPNPLTGKFTMANGDQFQIANWDDTELGPGGSTLIKLDSIGTVGSGFLQARRKLSYRINPANQSAGPSGPTSPPSAFPPEVSGFDRPDGGGSDAEWLGQYFTPTANPDTKIFSTMKADEDNALNLSSESYTMGLKWFANLSMAQLDAIRATNNGLLSYGVQIKIKNYDEDTNNLSPYNMIGISFRLDDSNDANMNDDWGNMYGISFVKLIKPGNPSASDPAWYKNYIHTSGAWNYFSVTNAGKWFIVLWKGITSGGVVSFTPLAYQQLTSLDSVCREGTTTSCTKIKYWSTILVNVEEISGANKITAYISAPDLYRRSTFDNPDPLQPKWANSTTVPAIFKPINWINAATGVAITNLDPETSAPIFQDSSLTTSNYVNYRLGDITQIKAREIGLHIFIKSESAQYIFYDNFYIDLSPSGTGGGGGGYDGSGMVTVYP